ncbi:multidrug effflux MFS transporter [Acinetobacter chinensis]|jgi:DHA1 family bicyclomycin/chloramphenicol resistance-like MFS transporter|uniref:multidrug effflux MFS transporter n=1 Tax=Acinetobacter chinensis TaxID=2004650 RepID=UPI002934A7DE|nr:multidrug effflux MFS transporter [Acinetobacter chinensis]WOE42598.1 multidrug effflux MFS transporter [Acinetobacter chinensis]
MTQAVTAQNYKLNWILLLALLTSIAPLSTDMYLPALPDMAKEFSVTTLLVSSSLPAYFLGLAIGQLIYGPISDRIGRKIPLIFGLSLHITASLLCIYADDLQTLLIVRVLQALGSCVGLVLARAAIRDVLDTSSAAKAFASMMIVMGVAPVIAPTLGAWVLLFFHWHAIFIVLALLGVVSLLGVIFAFTETLPVERRLKLSFRHVFQLYFKIFRDLSYCFPMLAGCFSFGVLFCYINAATTVLMDSYHLSEQQFAYAFGLNAVGTMFLSAMNHKLEHKFSVLQRLSIGGFVQITGVCLLLIAALLPQMGLPLVLIGLFLAVAGIGLTAPNSTALAMSKQGRQAGSASALMGGFQFLFGLLSGILLNFLPWTALFNLSMAMLLFVLCANVSIFAAKRFFSIQPVA